MLKNHALPTLLFQQGAAYPTAFGPPPPGLFTDSQQSKNQESQQTNKATRNQPKQLPKSTKNRPKLASRDPLGGDPGAMLASKIGLGGVCWAQKSVLEGLLGGLGAILAPRANQDPQG